MLHIKNEANLKVLAAMLMKEYRLGFPKLGRYSCNSRIDLRARMGRATARIKLTIFVIFKRTFGLSIYPTKVVPD